VVGILVFGRPSLAAVKTKPSGTCWTGIWIAKITTNCYRYNTAQCSILQVYVGRAAAREETLSQDSHQRRKKMTMIVKAIGSQVGSPAAAEEVKEVARIRH